jgi:hypothetical protein
VAIRRLLGSVAVALILVAALAGGVAAQGQRCVGTGASTTAGPGFGQFIADYAQASQPFGAIMGHAASTDDCSNL